MKKLLIKVSLPLIALAALSASLPSVATGDPGLCRDCYIAGDGTVFCKLRPCKDPE